MIEHTDLRRAERHLRRADPSMASVVKRVGPCGLIDAQRKASFAALARAIVFQQLSGKAATTIYKRVLRVLGRRQPNPKSILAAAPDELRGAGLSGQKFSYLQDLAEKVDSGELSLRRLRYLDNEEVSTELTRVKGVGPWTADMYLIFHLGRLDVLPVGDLGVRSGTQAIYELEELPDADTLRRIAEPWRPYRSVASWYLWRVLDGNADLA